MKTRAGVEQLVAMALGALADRAPHIRASDADRERTAAFLKRHCAEGRLTPEELEERLEAVYAARTLGDLGRVTTDLPRASRPPARREPARGRPGTVAIVAAAVGLCAAAMVLPALPWLGFGMAAAVLGAGVVLVFSLVSVAPLVALVAGTAWVVRRLWPRGGRPLHPLP